MRRWRALLWAVMLMAACLVPASRATADPDYSEWVYRVYDQTVTLDAQGNARVVLNAELDMADEPGHGPSLVFITKQKITPDSAGRTRWRILKTKIISVTSNTGASTKVNTKTTDTTLGVKIGDPNRTYTGVQQYTITYEIKGIVTPDQPASGLDEFNWNAIGRFGNVSHSNATVSVTGTVAAMKVACFQGESYDHACQSNIENGKAIYHAINMSVDDGMQVTAGYPMGTFPASSAVIQVDKKMSDKFPVNVPNGIGFTLTAAGAAWGLVRFRQRNRDQRYTGVAPGSVPDNAATAPTTTVRAQGPVSVRFNPPDDGATPAEIRMLMTKKKDPQAITAILIDLAVRGYVQISHDKSSDTWTYERMKDSGPELNLVEQGLMKRLFKKGTNSITNTKLSKTKIDFDVLQAMLEKQVTKNRQWFPTRPSVARTSRVGLGIGGTIAGLTLAFGLGDWFGLGWVGVALMLAGVGLTISADTLPPRTARGSAMLAQAEGFKKYLGTAEADQIKWEADADIFSRYLPWAMVFGVTDHWTKLFEQISQQTGQMPAMAWYAGGYASMHEGLLNFGHTFDGMARGFEHSMSSAQNFANDTSGVGGGSGGFSGFSGGGGFGGGGSGGW